jgi:hypothetical protein
MYMPTTLVWKVVARLGRNILKPDDHICPKHDSPVSAGALASLAR